jgi:hypothetical protein
MRKAGYGPDNPLKIQVSTRNTSYYRDPAVLLIDQLKRSRSTSMPISIRSQGLHLSLNITEAEVDDPDPAFYEN